MNIKAFKKGDNSAIIIVGTQESAQGHLKLVYVDEKSGQFGAVFSRDVVVKDFAQFKGIDTDKLTAIVGDSVCEVIEHVGNIIQEKWEAKDEANSSGKTKG